jgi:hypothetical protein
MHRHAPHLSDAGDAVGDEKRQQPLVVPMHVHVSEAWNQELARRIDDLRVGGNPSAVSRRDDCDFSIDNDDGRVAPDGPA